MDRLEATRDFWDSNPCGGQPNHEMRRDHRNRMAPWLRGLLDRIASAHKHILEVGCGQGTDALYLCAGLPPDGSYIGLDYSTRSLEAAGQALAEADHALNVIPDFRHGNAEDLPFDPDSIDCVYSLGVLHHTPNTEKAVDEVYRVLTVDGKAYVLLYNFWSPKVMIAKILRSVQRLADLISGKQQVFYGLIRGRHWERVLGTMVLECFGVPVMRCYRKNQIRRLFGRFESVRIEAMDHNIPWIHSATDGKTALGVLWLIEATKGRGANT